MEKVGDLWGFNKADNKKIVNDFFVVNNNLLGKAFNLNDYEDGCHGFREITWVGQDTTHFAHLTHLLLSIYAFWNVSEPLTHLLFPERSVIASWGHTSKQVPHPIQFSLSILTKNFVFPLFSARFGFVAHKPHFICDGWEIGVSTSSSEFSGTL